MQVFGAKYRWRQDDGVDGGGYWEVYESTNACGMTLSEAVAEVIDFLGGSPSDYMLDDQGDMLAVSVFLWSTVPAARQAAATVDRGTVLDGRFDTSIYC